jgi:hypothetical protein
VEWCIDTGFDIAEEVTANPALHLSRHQLAVPKLAQLIGGDGDRSQAGSRFTGYKTKSALELGWNQRAQRDIIEQHEQADVACRLLRRAPHGHITGDSGNFR